MLALFLLLLFACSSLGYTNQPIVGILGKPNGKGQSFFEGFYVQWLEQAGARIVPIPYNISDEQLSFFASRLNGFLFTGGGLDLELTSPYVKTAMKIFKLAQTEDPIPLWGTCMGFQVEVFFLCFRVSSHVLLFSSSCSTFWWPRRSPC